MQALYRTLSILTVAILAAACARAPSVASVPAIRLNTSNPQQTAVEVTGLSARDRATLTKANLTSDEWSDVFRVVVRSKGAWNGERTRYTVLFDPGGLAALGRHRVAGRELFSA